MSPREQVKKRGSTESSSLPFDIEKCTPQKMMISSVISSIFLSTSLYWDIDLKLNNLSARYDFHTSSLKGQTAFVIVCHFRAGLLSSSLTGEHPQQQEKED